MDKDIKIKYQVEDETQSGTSSVIRNIKRVNGQIVSDVSKTSTTYMKNGQKIVDTNEQINKSMKSMSAKSGSSMGDFAKKVVGAFLTVQALKKGMGFLKDSFLEFDKAAGTGMVDMINTQFKQLQLEVGSVLMPEMKKFSKWFEDNKQTITAWAQGLTKIFIELGKFIGGVFDTVASIVTTAFSGIVTYYLTAMKLVMGGINKIVQMSPLSKTIKESIGGAYQAVSDQQKLFWDTTKESAKGVGDSLNGVWGSLKGIGGAISGIAKGETSSSGITVVSERAKELAKNLQQSEDATNEFRLSMIKTFDITQLNGYDKSLAEINYKYEEQKTKLSELLVKMDEARKASGKGAVGGEIFATFEKIIEKTKDYEIARLEITEGFASKILADEEATAKYRYDNTVRFYGDSISAINTYYDDLIRIADIRMEDLTTLQLDKRRALLDREATLQEEYASGTGPKSGTYEAQIAAVEKETDRRIAIYNDMATSVKFTEAQLANYRISIEQYVADETKRINDEKLSNTLSSIQSQYNEYAQYGQMVMDIANNMSQIQINNINKETEERLTSLDASFNEAEKYTRDSNKLAKYKAKAEDKIRKEQEEKIKEEKKKQKKWSIANAIISGAEATLNAWASAMKLAYPANIIAGVAMSAVITALTASQVALISSQTFAKGGIVQGPETGDKVPVQANGGEMILTKAQQSWLFNKISTGNNQGISPQIQGDTFIIHGNLDQNAAKQIRGMKEERMYQLKMDLKELSYRGQMSLA